MRRRAVSQGRCAAQLRLSEGYRDDAEGPLGFTGSQESRPDQIQSTSYRRVKGSRESVIQYRDLHCEAARHQFEGGSMSPMIRGFCMAQTTLHRIDELKFAHEKG